MTAIPSSPVDQPTEDTLALMRLDPRHNTDQEIILAAVEMVAAEHDGIVDPNELRRLITGRVQPNVIGAVVQGLAKKGLLEPHGFTVTTGSSSHNNGRPARVWRWLG